MGVVDVELTVGECMLLKLYGVKYLAGETFDITDRGRTHDTARTLGKVSDNTVREFADSLVEKGLFEKMGGEWLYSLTELGQSSWEALAGSTYKYARKRGRSYAKQGEQEVSD